MDTLVKWLFPGEQVAMMATGVWTGVFETDATDRVAEQTAPGLCLDEIGWQEGFRLVFIDILVLVLVRSSLVVVGVHWIEWTGWNIVIVTNVCMHSRIYFCLFYFIDSDLNRK